MNQAIPTVSRHPEWRILYDAIQPYIEAGITSFSYDDLSEMAKIDIRQMPGRIQFYQFRKHFLKDRSLWFECVHGFGYAIIPAKDHPKAAVRRIDQAKRKVRLASAINRNVDYEKLDTDQRIVQAATAAVLYNLSKQFRTTGKLLEAASKATARELPVNLQELLASVRPKQIKQAV